jgi:hypothetical protein
LPAQIKISGWPLGEENSERAPTNAQRFLQDNPGSPGAIQRGCTCPEAENNFGRGRSKNGVIEASFATDTECPIHGIDALLNLLDEHDLLDDVIDAFDSDNRSE